MIFQTTESSLSEAATGGFYKKDAPKNRNIHWKTPVLKSIFNKVAGVEEHLWTAASALPPPSCTYFSECSLRLQVIRTTNLSTTEKCVCNACNFMITGNPFLSILIIFQNCFFTEYLTGVSYQAFFLFLRNTRAKLNRVVRVERSPPHSWKFQLMWLGLSHFCYSLKLLFVFTSRLKNSQLLQFLETEALNKISLKTS